MTHDIWKDPRRRPYRRWKTGRWRKLVNKQKAPRTEQQSNELKTDSRQNSVHGYRNTASCMCRNLQPESVHTENFQSSCWTQGWIWIWVIHPNFKKIHLTFNAMYIILTVLLYEKKNMWLLFNIAGIYTDTHRHCFHFFCLHLSCAHKT